MVHSAMQCNEMHCGAKYNVISIVMWCIVMHCDAEYNAIQSKMWCKVHYKSIFHYKCTLNYENHLHSTSIYTIKILCSKIFKKLLKNFFRSLSQFPSTERTCLLFFSWSPKSIECI